MARIVGISILILAVASGLKIGGASGMEAPAPATVPVNAPVCERISGHFSHCLGFLVGSPDYERPSKRCCSHIEELNMLANHEIDPHLICWCIQLMVKGQTPPLVPSRINDLPMLCNTHLSFPISDSMDCSKLG